MSFDYSQRQLLSKVRHSKNRKLKLAAFWMGVASAVISFVHLVLLVRA